ncbi:uncharacterized protein LOC141885749 isoform X1 [Acropora palmata]|uniref:uncharacterized protein LOC141885749 isoform X1 n=1 Tax=Acropora palmata TaxID=6131 RepID=UPI003DA01380
MRASSRLRRYRLQPREQKPPPGAAITLRNSVENYWQTTILANANKERGKGEGQLVTQKQYLELKTPAQLPRGSSLPGTSGSLSQEVTEGYKSLISSRKLNVTLLGSEWESTKGGLSTFNRELAIHLAKNDNVEVSMYLPQCSEKDKRAATKLRVHLLEVEKKPACDPIESLASVPREHCMDIVIGHGIHLGQQVPRIKQLRPNCKWIQFVHTDAEELGISKDYPCPTAKGEKKHKAEVELCEWADQVVAVGPKLAETFARYLRPSGKDQDVINFTPGLFSEFSNINQATQEGEVFCVLVFGCGDREDFCVKGYDIAAQAVAKLKDEGRSFKLMFVGAPNGEEEKVKKRFIKEGISQSQLIVRSAKNRKQLAKQFYEADLVIMPSRSEGFGLAALEALSAGLPVLVSDDSGIGKALKKVPNGSNCVIRSEDPVKWAEAIKAVCRKERKVRLEEAILLRQKYAETYQWEGQCSKLVEKMCEMIKGVDHVTLDQGASLLTSNHLSFAMDSQSRIKESRGKRPLHTSVITTPERKRQNRHTPERVDYPTFDRGYSSLRSYQLESSMGAQALIQHGETSTAPDQAVVAVNLGEQGPSSISEAVVHPDLTKKNQHIVVDEMSSDRENEFQRKRPSHLCFTTTAKRQRRKASIPEKFQRKRPSHLCFTTTAKRQRRKASIPESKA